MKKAVLGVVFLALTVPMSALADRVTCESRNNQLEECAMNTQGDVRLVQQLSHTRCEQGVNWGLNRHTVWVNNGCRAVFESVSSGSSSNVGADWDRGCSDAKGGSYDRSRHSDAYEEGWQACNSQQQSSGSNVGADWDRGCSDAKGGSYDRSRHSDAYEEGWQACNNQNSSQNGSSDDFGQREWERGCSDAKGGSYDRSRHSDEYEEGWQECNRNK